MNDAEAIVRDLARLDPLRFGPDGPTCVSCRFMFPVLNPWTMAQVAENVRNPEGGHSDLCAWARARRWVAEHPV